MCHPGSHLVDIRKWDVFLPGQFREMERVDRRICSKRILIASETHAMACKLTITKNVDAASTCAINFYDPNVTASHRRIPTQILADIELGQVCMVSTFTRLILASDTLSPDQKCHILNVRPSKVNLLNRLPCTRPSRTAQAYVDAVQQSGLARDLRARLLAGS